MGRKCRWNNKERRSADGWQSGSKARLNKNKTQDSKIETIETARHGETQVYNWKLAILLFFFFFSYRCTFIVRSLCCRFFFLLFFPSNWIEFVASMRKYDLKKDLKRCSSNKNYPNLLKWFLTCLVAEIEIENYRYLSEINFERSICDNNSFERSGSNGRIKLNDRVIGVKSRPLSVFFIFERWIGKFSKFISKDRETFAVGSRHRSVFTQASINSIAGLSGFSRRNR